MLDILRDSSLGQCLRLLSGGRIAEFPERLPSFQLPSQYGGAMEQENSGNTIAPSGFNESASESVNPIAPGQPHAEDSEANVDGRKSDGSTPSTDRCDGPRDRTNSGDPPASVTWYSSTDSDNPHNWSAMKKGWLSFVILLYTFVVYIGSSLYTASESDIVEKFGVSSIAASLGLSIYVIGYGVGPLLLSPLSEIPEVGRNPPYILTFTIFVLLCVAISLVQNFGGLLVLRFLLGFFGSPCLATGGASYGDFYTARAMPYVIALWGGGATLGPVSLFPSQYWIQLSSRSFREVFTIDTPNF